MSNQKLNYFGINEDMLNDAKKEYYKTLTLDQINSQDVYVKQTNSHKMKYAQYMGSKIKARDLQDEVTQPYYQSLILNRKRLDEKNINIDMNIETNGISDLLPFEAKNDDKFVIGERQDALKVKRTFMHHGKKIKKIKSKETCKVTLLNLKVGENFETFCPNCGYPDTLSGFINGCDACGASFTVNDFKPKVAGFSMQENRVSKYYGNILKAWLAFFITYILAAIFVASKVNLVYGIASVMVFFTQSIPAFIGVLFIISKVLKNVWDTVTKRKSSFALKKKWKKSVSIK